MPPAVPTDEIETGKLISHSGHAAIGKEGDVICAENFSTIQSGWNVRASEACLRTVNPIRKITDSLKPDPLSTKKLISLGAGDPTVYGHLKAPDCAGGSIVDVVSGGRANGYAHSLGIADCRKALAEHLSPILNFSVNPETEVIMTAGTNHALDLCFQALCSPGSNVLIPRPGYPLYESFLGYMGVEYRYYDLQPDQDWEVDLGQVERSRDGNTAALLVCNPGNPCGSVYRRGHLEGIIKTAEKLKLPIISDEVYGGIAFEGAEYIPLASLPSPVPILTVSSISKKYLVPGWRLGWIVIKDPAQILLRGRVQEALAKLMQFAVQPSSLIQAALRNVLEQTPPDFLTNVVQDLEQSATACFRRSNAIPGLRCPSKPQGSMFVMIEISVGRFSGIEDDVEWCAQLLKEESVVVIPGQAFQMPGWARVVFALPVPVLEEAWDRIEGFCSRRYVS